MTRIVCTADIHEHLPEIPECDLLLIAGDVSFAFKGDLATEHAFLEGPFAEWLERVPAAETVLVAGNHDQSIEAWGVPAGLRCHYLEDAGAELCGLKLWGTPWQPWFYDWAFNAPRHDGERVPRREVRAHPERRRHRDLPRTAARLRRSTAQRVVGAHRRDRAPPAAARRGRPHPPGYGRYRLGETEIINAAYVDNDYQPVNPLVEVEL